MSGWVGRGPRSRRLPALAFALVVVVAAVSGSAASPVGEALAGGAGPVPGLDDLEGAAIGAPAAAVEAAVTVTARAADHVVLGVHRHGGAPHGRVGVVGVLLGTALLAALGAVGAAPIHREGGRRPGRGRPAQARAPPARRSA